jgi:hypothetical protein
MSSSGLWWADDDDDDELSVKSIREKPTHDTHPLSNAHIVIAFITT